MTQAAQSRVFVDGNNVTGSRPDGWWRDRAVAARRLVAQIIPLALGHGGVSTIVFDGYEPPAMPPSPERLTVVNNGHAPRDEADDRIVELVGALPDGPRPWSPPPTRSCAVVRRRSAPKSWGPARC